MRLLLYWDMFMKSNCNICALWYLLLVLGGTGILVSGSQNVLLHHTHKALLRLRMEGHRALRQLLDAHGMVPLC